MSTSPEGIKPNGKLDVIHKSLWGSHAWGLDHPGSDMDYFTVYVDDPRKLLGLSKGRHGASIRNKQETHKTDEMKHDIGHVAAMLRNMNVNYVIGVMSPAVEYTTPEMKRLQDILRRFPCRDIYKSAMGLADGNFKKYILMREEDTPKKRRLIMRNLLFARRVIEDGVFDFKVVKPDDEFTIEQMGDAFRDLKKAYEASEMRREVPHDMLDRWVFDIRMDRLRKAGHL